MPKASPTPTQIVIPKIGAVIIPKPNFFLKLLTCLTRGKKGKKQFWNLNFSFVIKKMENQKLHAMSFGVSSGSESGSNWRPVPSFGSGCWLVPISNFQLWIFFSKFKTHDPGTQ